MASAVMAAVVRCAGEEVVVTGYREICDKLREWGSASGVADAVLVEACLAILDGKVGRYVEIKCRGGNRIRVDVLQIGS